MATILKRNETENRYELHIDGKLIGYTTGANEDEHKIGASTLKDMAEEKGHSVQMVEGVNL
jgi:hypothetical protein